MAITAKNQCAIRSHNKLQVLWCLMSQLLIKRRFCGPPNSGNGGYVCGLVANYVEGCAEVTLRSPPPLEQPLDIRKGDDNAVALCDGDSVVATARSGSLEITAPPFVPFVDAQAAAAQPLIAPEEHLLPTCFVCGPDRGHGDGMRLFAGPVANSPGLLAVPWIPDDSLPHEDGRPLAEILWAALDCPTGYAAYAAIPEAMLLGRMVVAIHERPLLGEKCVVTACFVERAGRKIVTDGAVYGENGHLLAAARNTWITVPLEVQQGQA